MASTGVSMRLPRRSELLAARNRVQFIPTPPSQPYRVDVVIPFCDADSQYLAASVQSIIDQKHVIPTIHIISDAAKWPELPTARPAVAIVKYQSRRAESGPYRLTNSVVRHGNCQSDYLAIQDADDISLPDRLWRQIATINHCCAGIVSSAAKNFVCEKSQSEELEQRCKREPVIYPGRIYSTVPRGHSVNGCRTVRLEVFRRMNGFQNMSCAGDFDFDNRCRYGGVKVIDDQTILLLRRLHGGSLTNGSAKQGSDKREKDRRVLMRTLEVVRACRNCIRNFGALETAAKLEVL